MAKPQFRANTPAWHSGLGRQRKHRANPGKYFKAKGKHYISGKSGPSSMEDGLKTMKNVLPFVEGGTFSARILRFWWKPT
jgi:hypothetical protein